VRNLLCVAIVSLAALLALGCSSGAGPGSGIGPAASISISPKSVTLESGDTRSFSATVTDAGGQQVTAAEVTWSADAAIGSIDSATGVFTAAQVTAITVGRVTAKAAGTALSATADVTVTATAESLGYAGSPACLSCHADKHGPWSQSSHALSLRGYQPGLPGVPDPWGGGIDPSGVAYVLGAGAYARQFLIPDTEGRELLVHPSRYSVASGAWSAVHPDDWQNRPWRVHCAGCHVTGFDESIQAPRPFAEPGVGCEACHGPGAEHVASGSEADIPSLRPADGEITAARAYDICASCHSRGRSPSGVYQFAEGFVPGAELSDHFTPVAEGDAEAFWPRAVGAPLVSRLNYQQAIDLRQSPGHGSCMDCHDPHGPTGFRAQLREAPETDALCLGCHGEMAGAEHSHHPVNAGVPTVTCVACHMPRTATSALPQDIASHAMLPIPPSATALTLGQPEAMPNSCMSAACHQQADPARPAMPVYPFDATGVAAAQAQWNLWYGG
jgi:predicted CXXCH cytochrome family protein